MANQDFEQLLGTIRVLNQQLDILRNTINQFQTEFRKTGSEEFSRALAQQRILAEQLSNRLADAVNQYNRLKQAAQRGAVNTIPGGFEEPAGQTIQDRFKAAGNKNTAGINYGNLRGGFRGPDPFAAADKSETEIQRIERERIESLRATLASEKRYEAAVKMAERQGFTLEDLKNVRTRGTGNINQLQFEKYNELGIKQNLDIFTTQGGRATPGISNQFRTFGQGVLRDIGELTKWSLALAAVYGPLRKLGDLTQEMIANQTKLADATISVNNAFTGQAEIFNVSADAARRSGEAISGVIDAFTQAYRATGGVGDNVTRLSTAQKLLADSLTLSKLSTLDQAQAIDTLSAAMRQTFGQDLTRGTELLDKWVRVTKVANVDLATLATGFATVGDAAGNVGLNIDELNGVLAVLAESTNQTGQEVANTSRAIIAGFQSDQGVQALESLGIATKDATGNMRSLKDVIQEVASLRNQKIIDDTQFSKLTLAIGGGTRRQAAVATFLENYKRAIDVANQSANAGGDAQAALDKQLNTVQTDLTRLANAFTTLAQTMGGEGGFLTIIQTGVRGLTSMVGIFDKLVSLLGKATPAMAAFIAASLVLKQQGRGGIQESLFGQGQLILPDMTNYQIQARLNQVTGVGGKVPISEKDKFSQFLGGDVLGKGAIGGIFQGLALSALPAILNYTNKEDKYGKTKAGADVLGGLTGGIVGGLVAGSPIVGAAIGTAISEAFVNATIARKTDIFGYVAPTFGEPTKTGTPAQLEENLRKAESNLYKSIGGGNESVGKFLTAGVTKSSQDFVAAINDAIKNRDKEAFNNLVNQPGAGGDARRKLLAQAGLGAEALNGAFANNQQIQYKPEYAAYTRASEQARKEFDQALAAYSATQTSGAQAIDTPFTRQVASNQKAFGDLISQIKESSRGQLNQQRLGGQVTGADYARKATALGGFDTKALQYYTAFGKEFQSMNKDISTATDAFNAFNLVITSGAAESVPELTAITGEIEKLFNILNDPKLQDKDALENLGFKNLDQVRSKLKELQETGAATLTGIYNQTRLNQLTIPNIQGDINKPLIGKEETLVEQRTKQLQDQFYQGFLKLPEDMYNALKESFDSFAVPVKEFEDAVTGFKEITQTDAQMRQAAIAQLTEEGKIASQSKNPFGIQQLDITSQQGAGLQGSIDYYSKYLANNFPQYQQKPEEFGVIFSDYVTNVLHGDNLAVKLALEKLVDINQKQLDGMYNIPEGATFWVPLSAAYYKPKNEGGTGLPSGGASSDTANTTATQLNTQAISELTRATYENLETMRLGRHLPEASLTTRTNKAYDTLETLRLNRNATPTDRSYDTLENLRLDRGAQQEKLPGGTPTFRDTSGGMEALRQAIINGLSSLTQAITNKIGPGSVYGEGSVQNRAGGRDMTNFAPQVSARLDLRVESSTQLIVDGRVLATLITPYLASDLVKLEASQGTITKRYVI